MYHDNFDGVLLLLFVLHFNVYAQQHEHEIKSNYARAWNISSTYVTQIC